MNGTRAAVLERPGKTEVLNPPPKARMSAGKVIAIAGVAVYGLGMLAAMIGTIVQQGDWLLLALVIPQALCAVLFGAGAMGGALLAPDPYVKSH